MRITFALAFIIGCSDPAAVPLDALADASPPDQSVCGDGVLVRGTLVDLDHSLIAPLPIAGAGIGTTTTDAAGKFALCMPVPEPAVFRLWVDAPGDYLDGELYLEQPDVEYRPIRTMTATRAASFYTELGETYDASRGQLLVLQLIDGVPLTLQATHDEAHAAYEDNDNALVWDTVDNGRYELFPNIEATTATKRLDEGPSLDPDVLGRRHHDITVAPGNLSLAVLVAAYE